MRAYITGITGQDGSYLAEYLLSLGYDVFGLIRRGSIPRLDRISHILEKVHLYTGDLSDYYSLVSSIDHCRPNEVYNLAAQSFVGNSWDFPEYTANITGLGVTRMLNACYQVNKDIRFYQASSSEMFGKVRQTPQNEQTPFYPRSPYGVAKVFGHWATVNFRESKNFFAVSGICFNHESPRRGIEFVTKKITDGVYKIANKEQDVLYLGNLDARRDWGYAKDYVEVMHRMLQQGNPDDFVIGTEETHSIREFCDLAFSVAGLNYKDYVKVHEKFYRPAEVDLLIADSTKAKKILNWENKTSFSDLVRLMVLGEFTNDNKMQIV